MLMGILVVDNMEISDRGFCNVRLSCEMCLLLMYD